MSTKDSGLAAHLYRQRQYEFNWSLDAVRLLKDQGLIPSNGGAMLDVGANIGIISIGLLLNGSVEKSIAVEPEPYNFSLLKKNINQNSLEDKVTAIQMAVGERSEELTMNISPSNYGDHRISVDNAESPSVNKITNNPTLVKTSCSTLSEILLLVNIKEKPSFLWIDVQGYEGFAFKGADKLLKGGLSTVTEIWPRGIFEAGMSLDEFSEVVNFYWTYYWAPSGTNLKKFRVEEMSGLLEQLRETDKHTNVIFTNS